MRRQLGLAPHNALDTATVRYVETLKGESAYEIAVRHGFVGTEEEWLASLEGPGSPFLVITQAEYDALSPPDPDTLYVIRG